MSVYIKTQIWQNGDIFLENASAERRVSPKFSAIGTHSFTKKLLSTYQWANYFVYHVFIKTLGSVKNSIRLLTRQSFLFLDLQHESVNQFADLFRG